VCNELAWLIPALGALSIALERRIVGLQEPATGESRRVGAIGQAAEQLRGSALLSIVLTHEDGTKEGYAHGFVRQRTGQVDGLLRVHATGVERRSS
jgi:hypothetical protein